MKFAIVERAHHAKVEVDSEIFGLFQDLVPAVELNQRGELDTELLKVADVHTHVCAKFSRICSKSVLFNAKQEKLFFL